MKRWFQNWLGISEIAVGVADIQLFQLGLADQQEKIREDLGAILPGLGRVIAKLDPMYGRDELDPERIAESDAIGEAVIERLKDEHAARMHMEGKE